MSASTAIVDAALQGMKETREQLRALREELEASLGLGTAEQREEAERERRHAAVMDVYTTRDPPPDPSVRKKLIPNWARKKWLG